MKSSISFNKVSVEGLAWRRALAMPNEANRMGLIIGFAGCHGVETAATREVPPLPWRALNQARGPADSINSHRALAVDAGRRQSRE
jgi:hypothetical protein